MSKMIPFLASIQLNLFGCSLDEPTSGLDSQAAYEIVRFLRKIAASGIAVLCTSKCTLAPAGFE